MDTVEALKAEVVAAPFDTTVRAALADAMGEQTGNFERAVQDAEILAFVARCQAKCDKRTREDYPDSWDLQRHVLTVDPNGKRYIRIVVQRGMQRSVYCFVERETGNVLKADGWKRPAKHARGNIRDSKQGMGGVTQYGGVYLR